MRSKGTYIYLVYNLTEPSAVVSPWRPSSSSLGSSRSVLALRFRTPAQIW